MRAIKGLLIYIGIILGSIVGLGLILLCVMYFVPSVRIFGVGVVHYGGVVDEDSIAINDYSSYSSIELNVNSRDININIVPTDDNAVNYSLKLNIFGISSEIVEYRVTKNCSIENDVLKINLKVTEPKGWISTNESALTVNVPSTKLYSIYTTSERGSVNLGSSKASLKLKSINIVTGKGNLWLTNVGDGTNVKTLNLTSLNLSTDSGLFDLSGINAINVTNKVKFVANNGRFKFDVINATLEITGDDVRLDANELDCGVGGLDVMLKNGYFNVTKLSCSGGGENSIITDNTSFNVSEISGKTGIVTSYGDIKISKLHDYTMIENINGRVTIGTALDNIMIKTTMGDISVDNYYKSGSFTSKKGNITVNSKVENEATDFTKGYSTEINNVDGKVIVDNAGNPLIINTTGKSRVEVVFRKIVSELSSAEAPYYKHQIRIKGQGSGFVRIPTLNVPAFMFEATGGVYGELSGFENNNNTHTKEDNMDSDSPQYYPNSTKRDEASTSASFLFEGKIQLAGYSSQF